MAESTKKRFCMEVPQDLAQSMAQGLVFEELHKLVLASSARIMAARDSWFDDMPPVASVALDGNGVHVARDADGAEVGRAKFEFDGQSLTLTTTTVS